RALDPCRGLARGERPLGEVALDLLAPDDPGHEATAGKHDSGSPVDRELLAQLQILRDRAGAGRHALWLAALQHELAPGAGAIWSAPHQARLAGGVRMKRDDRKQEGVDRDVADAVELALELLAVGTIGIGEHRELARAAALDRNDGAL